MSGLISADTAATDDPASCPTNKSILSIFKELRRLIISVFKLADKV